MIARHKDDMSDPHVIFIRFVALYVILLSVSAAVGSGAFRAFSYVVALLMPVTLALKFSGRRSSLGGMEYMAPLIVYYYGMLGSMAYNYAVMDYALGIKLLMAPIFLVLGARVESASPATLTADRMKWYMFVLLVLLPLAVLALQLAKGANLFARGAEFSIFANRNNAGLYAVVLLALFAVLRRRTPTNVLIYLLVGMSFGTLGVLFAMMLSLVLMVAKRENIVRFFVGATVFVICMYLLAVNEVWIFARFKPVFWTLELILDPRVDLSLMSYERLFRLLHTTDLSLAFRIKHWHDLVSLLTSQSPFEWIFGMGIGSSVRLSLAKLPPHNDFLRMAFECGIVTLIGFVSLITIILTKMGRRWETVPFLAIALYMFSENLVDNFLAISIYYYTAGAILSRLGQAKADCAASLQFPSPTLTSQGKFA